MAANTKIEWATHTFNPWWGCTKLSPACDHCYAEALDRRVGGAHWGPHAERRRTSASNWKQPIKWDREAAATGTRPRVFCASMADVFDNQVPDDWRIALWHLIGRTWNLDWLLLTKRPQNIARMLPGPKIGTPEWGNGWRNVWLGTTAENQEEADRRIPVLLNVPAAKHFISAEPLLGPVDLTSVPFPRTYGSYLHNALTGTGRDHHGNSFHLNRPRKLDWVIVGGESGPGARPMHPAWARSLRDQCQAAGVAFHFKQWGIWAPAGDLSSETQEDLECRDRLAWVGIADGHRPLGNGTWASDAAMERIGKARAGRLLDGRTWDEVPA